MPINKKTSKNPSDVVDLHTELPKSGTATKQSEQSQQTITPKHESANVKTKTQSAPVVGATTVDLDSIASDMPVIQANQGSDQYATQKIVTPQNIPNNASIPTESRIEMRADDFNSNNYNHEDRSYKVDGILEIKGEYGILRQKESNGDAPKDVYVALTQINKFGLRKADRVEGLARAPKDNERYLSLLRVDKVEGIDSREARNRPRFEKLTPIFPNQRLKLETTPDVLSTRLIDLLSPIGKGQRGMVVAPPKAGKTWLLTDIAGGIAQNHKEITLMVVLIGERPEEVTHIQREVKGEVWASNFDESAQDQVNVAEVALEKAKRIAEKGGDVVVLMDSITRLARAYNLVEPPSGRTLTGGFDPAALYPPKRFFGAARKFEEGGSLTIIATALVDTGSRMDDVIFEEFKGTGNMELFLDRPLAERRIFPAIDIKRSMTRHDELLYTKKEQEKVLTLRRMVDLQDEKEATQIVIERLKKTKNNDEFLDTLTVGKI